MMTETICNPCEFNRASTLGEERILATPGEDFRKLQLQLDRLQRVRWIQEMASPGGWEVMATFTFRWESSLDSTRRIFEKWMRQRFCQVSYFYGIEENPSRDGCHVHALWADCRGVFRREAWANWFKRYGRAVVEPVRSKGDSAEYASKYLCKPNAWFNAHLQWHRLEALRGAKFSLSYG